MREQKCQDGTLARQYANQGIADGTELAVLVTGLTVIPQDRYRGTDIARSEGSVC